MVCSFALNLVFAPIGGFQSVTNAMEKLAHSLGVETRCGKTVTRISNDGVYLEDGSFEPASLVVVNADLPYATESLEKPDDGKATVAAMYDWNDRFDYSSGVIAFHWSIGKVLADLNTHNVFLASKSRQQVEDSWRCLRTDTTDDSNRGVEPFNFYVHRAGGTDPTAAPGGCDALLVLVPCAALERRAEWAALPREEAIARYKEEQCDEGVVAKVREAVLKRLSAIDSLWDLQDYILDETVDTPGTYADSYNVAAGTPFALVRNTFARHFDAVRFSSPAFHRVTVFSS